MTRLVPEASALWRLNIPRDREESPKDKLRSLMSALDTGRKEK